MALVYIALQLYGDSVADLSHPYIAYFVPADHSSPPDLCLQEIIR